VAPFYGNSSENRSSEVINSIVDKVVENPNLRNDYLYQLTHQNTVGFVGTAGEVEAVKDERIVDGRTSRGQVHGEDDKEVVTMPVQVDCDKGSAENGSGCKYKPLVPADENDYEDDDEDDEDKDDDEDDDNNEDDDEDDESGDSKKKSKKKKKKKKDKKKGDSDHWKIPSSSPNNQQPQPPGRLPPKQQPKHNHKFQINKHQAENPKNKDLLK